MTFDALMPATMAARCEESGVKKASMDTLTLLVLSVLAGAFISFGAIFATTVSAGGIAITAPGGETAFSAGLPYGVVKLLTGVVFSSGLILVIVGGAELFTGNNMIVMAWASGKVETRELLLNWIIVFAGNFIGAICTAVLMFSRRNTRSAEDRSGWRLSMPPTRKQPWNSSRPWRLASCATRWCAWPCGCAYGARTMLEKIVAIVPPVAAFVAAGFEHCIANIYYIPMALFIKAGAPDSFWTSIHKTPADFPDLTWGNFLFGNLVPVTIGNIIGGAIMVAAVYWFVYLRGANRKTSCSLGD